jgi:Stress responsive A/B Barrel Domain
MPVNHQVWIKFRSEASAEQIDAVLADLRALRGKVPGILDMNVGRNFTDRANGYQYGLMVILQDKASLEAYGPHPEHAKVAVKIRAIAESVMALDYEF